MPKFFMHVYNSESLCDPEGREFSDLDSACDAAREGASELIAEQIARGEIVDLRQRIEIADEHGEVAAVFRFNDFFMKTPV